MKLKYKKLLYGTLAVALGAITGKLLYDKFKKQNNKIDTRMENMIISLIDNSLNNKNYFETNSLSYVLENKYPITMTSSMLKLFSNNIKLTNNMENETYAKYGGITINKGIRKNSRFANIYYELKSGELLHFKISIQNIPIEKFDVYVYEFYSFIKSHIVDEITNKYYKKHIIDNLTPELKETMTKEFLNTISSKNAQSYYYSFIDECSSIVVDFNRVENTKELNKRYGLNNYHTTCQGNNDIVTHYSSYDKEYKYYNTIKCFSTKSDDKYIIYVRAYNLDKDEIIKTKKYFNRLVNNIIKNYET